MENWAGMEFITLESILLLPSQKKKQQKTINPLMNDSFRIRKM